jgi:tripartite-type tricarboxylate transporter receptor subunit TctC
LLAQVPTFAEAGYDNFATQRVSWMGLVGQAKLPQGIAGKLEATTQAVVADPAFSKWVKSQDYEPIGGTSAQFDKDLKREQAAVIGFIRNDLKLVPQ